MNTLVELLVEPDNMTDGDAIAHLVSEAVSQASGVTLESESVDTLRNLTGEEIAMSYLIGIASSVTVDVLLTLIRGKLAEKKLKAEVTATDMGNTADARKAIAKQQAMSLVTAVEPNDVFVVEEGFESMAEHWDQANSQDEGRFSGAEALSTFSALIVPFLLGLLLDTTKDVVKDQAKKAVSRLVEKHLKKKATDDDELHATRQAIETAIQKSALNDEQKQTLRDGFSTVYSSLDPKV